MTQVIKDIIGVYSTHPSAPLSLHARVKSFDEQAFYRLDQEQLALRVPAMRQTVYFLSKESALLTFRATIPAASDPYWEKRYSQKGREIPKENYQHWKEKIINLAKRPLTAAEIQEATGIPPDNIKTVLNRLAFEGLLLRVGANSFRSNIISYVATRAWALDHVADVDQDQALSWLAGAYLRAFGPARIKDFRWWAGVTAGKAKKAISTHPTVVISNDYLILEKDLNDFESLKITIDDRIDLLPRWDSYTMGFAPDGRERFVNPDMQHHLYGKIGATSGNALGAVLVNGEAYGSWDFNFTGSKMKANLNMFEKPSDKVNSAILNQLHEIGTLLKAKKMQIN
jgi:hypothetical protein